MKIRWLSDARNEQALCVVCRQKRPQRPLLAVSSPSKDIEYELRRCSGCAALQYDPMPMEGAFQSMDIVGMPTKHYVEVGAGIETISQLIVWASQGRKVRQRFLDVGCGFGFSVDFAKREMGMDAVGLEPSPYGEYGAHCLGIRVEKEMLTPFLQREPQRFDLVLSSEVLEHVYDPQQFVQTLHKALSTDGVLILTTPNADALRPDAGVSRIMPILSPGAHTVLFGPAALRRFLRRLRLFRRAELVVAGDQLLVLLSRRRGRIPKPNGTTRYQSYLRKLVNDFPPTSEVRHGADYRLLKDATNRGDWSQARDWALRTGTDLRARYGSDLLQVEAALAAAEGLTTFAEIGQRLPYFLPNALYFRGMEFLNGSRQPLEAAACFGAARQLARRFYDSHPSTFPEAADLLWRMVLHQGIALLVAGQRDKARPLFDEILQAGPEADPRVSNDVCGEALFQAAVLELQEGRPEHALVGFQKAAAVDGASRELLSRARDHARKARQLHRSMGSATAKGRWFNRLGIRRS